jgi:hypothetical protein
MGGDFRLLFIKKFMFILLLLLSSFSFATTFNIKEGNHYSTPRKVEFFKGADFAFKVKFIGQVNYNLQDSDQYDVNKLYGFSDCGNSHHENSARFGWRWVNNKLEILAYVYVNGTFYFEKIGDLAENTIANMSISLSADKTQYIFKMNEQSLSMARGCQTHVLQGNKLYPYFGGNKVAPRDFNIQIEDVDSKIAFFSVDNLYPNPTINQFIKIKLSTYEDYNIGFDIYDMQGKLVYHKSPETYYSNGMQEEIEIHFGELASGLYLFFPYAEINGERFPGFNNGAKSLKFVVL